MMKLMGKKVPCLVDSGCDITIVPKTLTDRFKSLEVTTSNRRIWAANNTPIRIEGETVGGTMSMDPGANLRGRRRSGVKHRHKGVRNFRTKHLTIDGHKIVTLRRF